MLFIFCFLQSLAPLVQILVVVIVGSSIGYGLLCGTNKTRQVPFLSTLLWRSEEDMPYSGCYNFQVEESPDVLDMRL